MTEHFSFFDAIQDGNGHYDREYNAQQFTNYFKSLVTTGIMKGTYSELEVTTNGANMVSAVKSGVAFVEGRYYYNDALLELTHDTEVLGLNRIDRIVVRMDLNTEARYVKTFIKKGVPSTSPTAPALTRTAQIYEISLAQVLIIGGQTFIESESVTDERGNPSVCPWASSKILPSYDEVILDNHINDNVRHFSTNEKNLFNSITNRFGVKSKIVSSWNNALENGFYVSNGDAPTSGYHVGRVIADDVGGNITQKVTPYGQSTEYNRTRLSNGTWTPWKKILNQDDYDTLFTSVSNGKSLVANAITGKGVSTSTTAEFATMATNISKINVKKVASGTAPLSSPNGTFLAYNDGSNHYHHYITVSGLTFKPSIIIATNTNLGEYTALYDNTRGREMVKTFYNRLTQNNTSTVVSFLLRPNGGQGYVNSTGFCLPVVNVNVSDKASTVNWYAIE